MLWNVNTVELRGPGNQWECQMLVHVPHKLFQTGCHNQLGKAFFENNMHVSTQALQAEALSGTVCGKDSSYSHITEMCNCCEQA